jgi:Spy/CpxP family protein refolding chaperone
MKILRPILLCTSAALAIPAIAFAGNVPPPAHAVHADHHARGVGRLLHHLDLSTEQRARVQAIHVALKPRVEAVRVAARRDRDALVTMPPTDPAYGALLEQSQADAAQAIQLRGEAWAQIYAVLTPAQQARVPALVAEARQRRDARRRAWASTGEVGPT